ncbi:MAG: AAA family ATPase, partial [Anaerolineae bacterium]
MNCGSKLVAESATDGGKTARSNLDRYIPPELLSKLQSARGRSISGERRVITILFCDIKGSTAAAEKLDPEDWTEVVNGAFEHMIRPVYKYEGMVARLMGDAILAFFGAPIAHEDDPQRAVLAALDIEAGIEPYSKQVQTGVGIELKLRVGINTGLVVVGEIGSDLRLEYTATGDAINLAARMEQTARPGTIQISEATYKLVAPFFEFEALGEAEIKGKSEPVRTFRVIAAKGTPRQLRGVEGLSSPLVGREAELAALDERLHRLPRGEGAFLAIVGEAGLGKTSLVTEARRRAGAADRLTWLEGQALSYTQSISYYPWRQVIRRSIGAADNDSPGEVRRILSGGCARLELPLERAAFLEAILAVESEETLALVASHQGEALLQHLTGALGDYLRALARESALVVVLDDLHWMDAASLGLLESLMNVIEHNPIAFITMARPDRDARSWAFLEGLRERTDGRFQQFSLEPLPPEHTGALIGNLLGMQGLPEELRRRIMEKAE